MTQAQNNVSTQVSAPTLHLYHYVLRNGINESSETLNKRREDFIKQLQEFISPLTITNGKKAKEIIEFISREDEPSEVGNILNLNNIPPECKPTNGVNYNLLYLDDGTVSRRLAASRLNDTYFLRFTNFIPSKFGLQPLERFGDFRNIKEDLPIEIGQTVILAGIIKESDYLKADILPLAAECLNCYYGDKIKPDELIENEFLGSPFCIYKQPIPVKKLNEYIIESIRLSCVFIYKDEQTEAQANKIYGIFQDLLLSYHKINFFYSQSLALKKRLTQLYEEIERLTEKYHQQKWNSESLKKLPQDSLEYYKKISFLEDQARAIQVNSKNYQECLKQIEESVGQKPPKFFIEFEKTIKFYIDQIQSNIGFLTPGIQLYDKLMLSIQTQVNIDDAHIQKQQNQRQAKLGQLLTGSGAAIAIGQILYEPIKTTVVQKLDRGQNQISVSSLWYSAGLTIFLSIFIGYFLSKFVYQWFTKEKF
ncbi:MAG: hypothetical protein KME19_04870 [Microcoleus vaginatus WJT46-NPBG5]|jgi:hypothetical protein|nr:hypothetical protein [Microcoleus vaginatus WJT46-NPBG5]